MEGVIWPQHRRVRGDPRKHRRRDLLVLVSSAALSVLLLSSSVAASAFVGEMVVEGADGTTAVVGTGNSYRYCSTAFPATAAARRVNG